MSLPAIAITATTPCIRVPMDPRHIPTMSYAFDGDLAQVHSATCVPIHYENPTDGNVAQKREWLYEYCCIVGTQLYQINSGSNNAYYVVKNAKRRNSEERILVYPNQLDAVRLADCGVFDNPPFFRVTGL